VVDVKQFDITEVGRCVWNADWFHAKASDSMKVK